jgi:hypothetical protein
MREGGQGAMNRCSFNKAVCASDKARLLELLPGVSLAWLQERLTASFPNGAWAGRFDKIKLR